MSTKPSYVTLFDNILHSYFKIMSNKKYAHMLVRMLLMYSDISTRTTLVMTKNFLVFLACLLLSISTVQAQATTVSTGPETFRVSHIELTMQLIFDALDTINIVYLYSVNILFS